jgi:hypothetical protein
MTQSGLRSKGILWVNFEEADRRLRVVVGLKTAEANLGSVLSERDLTKQVVNEL